MASPNYQALASLLSVRFDVQTFMVRNRDGLPHIQFAPSLEAIRPTCKRLNLGDTDPHTSESLNSLINLYEAWNKPEKAKEWQVRLVQIEDYEE